MLKNKMTILTVLLLAVCLAGCAFAKENESGKDAERETLAERQKSGNEKATGENGMVENTAGQTAANGQSGADGGITGTSQTEGQNGSRILVAYFSATGTTRKLAEYAAEVTGADLYEIVPQEPYTDADLNWNDKKSRTSIEMNDSSIKPAIDGSVENMGQYDIVFIAYPIWWGDAPHIMDTFMESYDFSGKTIVPFCTSGGSGIGSSAENLHAYTDGSVTWLDGERLKSSSSREDMADWIRDLSLGIEVK